MLISWNLWIAEGPRTSRSTAVFAMLGLAPGSHPLRLAQARGWTPLAIPPGAMRLTFLQPSPATLPEVHEILGLRPPAENRGRAESRQPQRVHECRADYPPLCRTRWSMRFREFRPPKTGAARSPSSRKASMDAVPLTFPQPSPATLSEVHAILGIRPPAENRCRANCHGHKASRDGPSAGTADWQEIDLRPLSHRAIGSGNATPRGMDDEGRELPVSIGSRRPEPR